VKKKTKIDLFSSSNLFKPMFTEINTKADKNLRRGRTTCQIVSNHLSPDDLKKGLNDDEGRSFITRFCLGQEKWCSGDVERRGVVTEMEIGGQRSEMRLRSNLTWTIEVDQRAGDVVGPCPNATND